MGIYRIVFGMAFAALAVSAFADADDWVYDTSARPLETVSAGEAVFSGVFDSRWRDCEESEPGGLDMTPRGIMLIVM